MAQIATEHMHRPAGRVSAREQAAVALAYRMHEMSSSELARALVSLPDRVLRLLVYRSWPVGHPLMGERSERADAGECSPKPKPSTSRGICGDSA
jgi:hypothetical protein